MIFRKGTGAGGLDLESELHLHHWSGFASDLDCHVASSSVVCGAVDGIARHVG
ncbi:MAG: hypothetical protein JHD07_08855 [Bradyrhizobium sp.]|nr:hypothetical protein [Bradyrhizobium sp.]